ncbi:UNVERIFIED_CONTAM: hypothetical protein GTU68_053479 [Idotea baltica]|nr:hypothetical protein [Idotea baltica]
MRQPPINRPFLPKREGVADLVFVEGVMGLFDGPPGGGGSTADLAAHLGLPVILVIDAARQAQSAGALARGFAAHREDINLAGVICNRVASPRHERLLREGLARVDIPILGMLPPHSKLELHSRHLGLIQARERDDLKPLIESSAEWIRKHLDLAMLEGIADAANLARKIDRHSAMPLVGCPPLGQRMAVASDDAFAFAYPHLLADWQDQGAELLTFSPLAGEGIPQDADAIFLPGGYPELHAGAIAANSAFMAGLKTASNDAKPIYGECGGFMVLGEGLVDANGQRHQMAGLLSLETSFEKRRLSLGYREVTLATGSPLGGEGQKLRGHEFHYATILSQKGVPFARFADAAGQDLGDAGLVAGSVAGSFFHLVDAN